MKVADILQAKGTKVFSITSDITVYEALKAMGERNIGALLVIEGQQLMGIISERDYARKIILRGKASSETTIEEVMTSKLETVRLNSSIDDCMQIMTERHIRHLPIVEDGIVGGMISIGDLVKFVIEDQKQTIEQLQNYINS